VIRPKTIERSSRTTPYPSTISVSGLTGVVGKVTVSLNGLSHSFPDDLDIMLISPTGQKIMLMSDCGGGHPEKGDTKSVHGLAPSSEREADPEGSGALLNGAFVRFL